MGRSLSALLVPALWLALCAVASAQPPAAACSSLSACREALAHGDYGAAEAGFRRLRRGGDRARATLGLARALVATGRHDDARDLLRPLARRGALRVEASTLLGEVHAARGRLDEAQQAFEAAIGEPSAHRARVLLGRLLLRRGRSRAAQLPLMALIEAYNDGTIGTRDAEGLAYVAMAAAMLESPRDANDAFLESTRADPDRVETQLEWAELFLAKYDAGHAEESVQDALRVNPRSARARTLMARIRLAQSQDFVEAERELGEALAVDPRHVAAWVTRAGIALRDFDLEAASAHLEAALAVDPTDLEALSVRAALFFLRDDEQAYRGAVREILALNPGHSELYTVIADYADWEHRYGAIVEMAREALRIDPDDALAHATLGVNLLRLGEEREGLEALRAAWQRDRYNVRVHNLLNLYDDVIGARYEDVEAAPFVLRLPTEDRAVLEEDVTELLRDAWRGMRRRYRFTPHRPVRIELYASREHFSVRTSGLPNMGVEGVCFGRVVTAMSPRGSRVSWGEVTWHELAHVFHLQLSHNRVPRWFTEGLAEVEASMARPEWKRELDHRLWLALEGDRVPALGELNHAFTHARRAEDVSVAYYASTRAVAYLVERFGFDRIVRMLRAWGQGKSTEEVIEQVLGESLTDLDRAFRAHLEQELGARRDDFAVDFGRYVDLEPVRERASARPQDAAAQADLAAALLVHGEPRAARETAERALTLDGAQPVARFVAASVALGQGEGAAALEQLSALREGDRDGVEVRLLEARAALSTDDLALARAALERATRIDPARVEPWQGLVEVAGRQQDADLRLRALRHVVDIDEHDRRSLRELLVGLAAADAWDEALRFGERTVTSDPLHAESRRIYAEALLRADRATDALRQAEVALALEPPAVGPFHLTRAHALRALGRRGPAREAADAAVAAAPALEDAAAELRSR
ncbi:MAG: tetratricopeptide repeat protein [Sandaracinaceae bacterium]